MSQLDFWPLPLTILKAAFTHDPFIYDPFIHDPFQKTTRHVLALGLHVVDARQSEVLICLLPLTNDATLGKQFDLSKSTCKGIF